MSWAQQCVPLVVAAMAAIGAGIAGADDELAPTGSTIIYGDQVHPIVVDGTIQIYSSGALPLATEGDHRTYPIADHLGSARLITGDGAVAQEYAPYGTPVGAPGSVYAGHPYDPHQRLYMAPARNYDPSVGRFLSVDPGHQGASPYPYSAGDPINFLDPTGGIRLPFFVETNMSGFVGKASLAHLFGAPHSTRMVSSDSFQSKTGLPKDSRAIHNRKAVLSGSGKAMKNVDLAWSVLKRQLIGTHAVLRRVS